MDSLKLWEERDRGGGDVIVEVNGASTTAHWLVITLRIEMSCYFT